MRETARPGFDGSFIEDRRRNLAWLVFDGHRYHIDREASDAMLQTGTAPRPADELVEDIPIKGAIRTGSRLVRSDPNGAIHLFAVDVPEHRLHQIESWESFVHFGFDIGKVMLVPQALLQSVPVGAPICSALDRIMRRGHFMYLPLLEVLA